MFVSGLTVSPSKCCFRAPTHGPESAPRRAPGFPTAATPPRGGIRFLRLQRCNEKRPWLVHSAMEASYGGDMTNGQSVAFPRISVKDPYKRLGISKEASEEEIQAARNFLVQKYAGHKPSVDAIESAHDKIIMEKFYERINPNIDLNKRVREVKQSHYVQGVMGRFHTPASSVIVKTTIVFLILGALTILFPTEEGPTIQVAISLMATIYFIHDRLKSKFQAFLYGTGAFMFSWLFATFLMVSLVPPLPFIKGPRSFEVTSSLVTYIFLWVSSAFLK